MTPNAKSEMRLTKALIEHEHASQVGGKCVVRKGRESERWHAYWTDGAIERRDTYWANHLGVVLEAMTQFECGRWIQIQ